MIRFLILFLICIPVSAQDVTPGEIIRGRDRNRNRNNQRNQERREEAQAERERERQIEQARREIERRQEARRKAVEKMSLEMIKEAFKKAKEADKEERWSTAYTHYSDVARCKLTSAKDMIDQSRTRINEIDVIVETKVREGKKKETLSEFLAAASLYKEVSDDFSFSIHAVEAERRLAVMMRSPKSAPAIIYAEGQAAENAKEYLRARGIYKDLIDRYPDSLDALRASKRLKEFKDTEITASITKEQEAEAAKKAPAWLNIAENFKRNGMTERSLEYWERIVDEFPGTSWAEEASKLIDQNTNK